MTDVASIDAAVWIDAQRTTTAGGGSLVTAVLVEFEDHGPQAAANLLGRHVDDVQVVTHPDSGLPHLEYRNQRATITAATGTDEDDRIDYDQLGPVARAWYGARELEGR